MTEVADVVEKERVDTRDQNHISKWRGSTRSVVREMTTGEGVRKKDDAKTRGVEKYQGDHFIMASLMS